MTFPCLSMLTRLAWDAVRVTIDFVSTQTSILPKWIFQVNYHHILEGKSLNQGMPSVLIPSSTDEERSRQIDDRVWWDVNTSDSVRSPGHRLLPWSVKKQPQVSLYAKGGHTLVAALERLRLAYKPVVEANNRAIAAIFCADPLSWRIVSIDCVILIIFWT
jgi:hypothetical protein